MQCAFLLVTDNFTNNSCNQLIVGINSRSDSTILQSDFDLRNSLPLYSFVRKHSTVHEWLNWLIQFIPLLTAMKFTSLRWIISLWYSIVQRKAKQWQEGSKQIENVIGESRADESPLLVVGSNLLLRGFLIDQSSCKIVGSVSVQASVPWLAVYWILAAMRHVPQLHSFVKNAVKFTN